jgi:hypothetical protein
MRMYSRTALVVSGANAGEVNEPGNDSAGGATPLGPRTYVTGALNGTTDTSDYYTFSVPAAARVYVSTGYPGKGSGDGSDVHLGIVLCDSLVAGGCGSVNDLLKGTTSAVVPAGSQVWIRVTDTSPTPGAVVYGLGVTRSLTGVRGLGDRPGGARRVTGGQEQPLEPPAP